MSAMASDGSRGPKPYTQRRASTIFVRVPTREWAALRYGGKREFRAGSGKVSALWNVETPVPAVAYTVDSLGRYEAALMVLEAVWREPLGAITEESLAAEGHETFGEFRLAWCRRERRRFPALTLTTAYRVRAWTADDDREMGDVMLRRLYGEFLRNRAHA